MALFILTLFAKLIKTKKSYNDFCPELTTKHNRYVKVRLYERVRISHNNVFCSNLP